MNDRVRAFSCIEHDFIVNASVSEVTTRDTPNHRVIGCGTCDWAVNEAFAYHMGSGVTTGYVTGAVDAIAAKADDPEGAHYDEDALHVAVLEAIATGDHDGAAADLARAALRTREFDFARWYS